MLAFGLKVAAVGFSVVVTALVTLMLIISFQSKLFDAYEKRKTEKANEGANASSGVTVAEASALAVTEAVEADEELTEEELIAVISAAIAMHGGQRIVVRNICRVDQGKNWVDSGRVASMNGLNANQ